MPRLPRPLALAVPLLVAVAACGSSNSASPSPLSTSPASIAPAPSVAVATPVASADACAKDALKTVTAGKLTIGTANPARSPFFKPATPQPSDSPWKSGDPRTGEGLEAATAYAVAQKLGFSREEVAWVAMPVDAATAPGAKPFDYYLAQVPRTPDLSTGVDLSDPYFEVNQAVVGLEGNDIADASSVSALKAFRLGGPAGRSYAYITDQIKPTRAATSYDTLDAALSALKARKIDGLVVDLPIAFSVRDLQLTNAVIVGSLPNAGQVFGQAEPFAIAVSKPGPTIAGLAGNPLTACINNALAALKTDGTLKQITDMWITNQGAPELR
jgi:polar amino acid transport system substrate-binding protein